ncbi:hypothetical protein CDIK_0744 [Cucumispora dikerogammari]|nr:hypothetical protein CDIK_0744 [Cucumispora dikerogammari]
MLSGIIAPIINLFSSKSKDLSIEQKNLIIDFNALKESVFKIQKVRISFDKNFDIVFGDNYQSQFKYIKIMCEKIAPSIKQWKVVSQQLNVTTQDTKEKAEYNLIREAFLVQLFSLCNRFFSEIRDMISQETALGKPLNSEKMKKLFSDLNKQSSGWKKENAIDLSFLDAIKASVPSLTICYFSSKLAVLMSEETGLPRKTILRVLYPKINDLRSISNYERTVAPHFYYTFAYFLKYYKPGVTWDKKTHFLMCIRDENCDSHNTNNIDRLYFSIIKRYDVYLKTNLQAEFADARKIEKNLDRFKEYINNKAVLTSCCLSKERNLIALKCIKKIDHQEIIDKTKCIKKIDHQEIIDKTREQYFKYITRDFSNKTTFFDHRIIGFIEANFNYGLNDSDVWLDESKWI